MQLSVVLLIVVSVKQKTAYEMRMSDWSSDACSSDLIAPRNASACSPSSIIHISRCSPALRASLNRLAKKGNQSPLLFRHIARRTRQTVVGDPQPRFGETDQKRVNIGFARDGRRIAERGGDLLQHRSQRHALFALPTHPPTGPPPSDP